MDFKTLHAKYKDDDSPSVEGQIRWLQKQGFDINQIQQAMISVYMEIEQGKRDFPGPKKGFELDKYLLNKAKEIRTTELSAQIVKMEEFVETLKKKWEADAKNKKPFLQRIFWSWPEYK